MRREKEMCDVEGEFYLVSDGRTLHFLGLKH